MRPVTASRSDVASGAGSRLGHDRPNTRNKTMAMRPSPPPALPAPGATLTGYFVPPLVIPAALVMAVLLFALVHGPVN
jgi:hypothetical protein